MNKPIVDIIFGGQFGSESKRLFNEYYFNKTRPDAIISNFGPNSGGFVSDGGKWATFSFGASCIHMLSPGSIIDIDDFWDEYSRLPVGAKVYIHENACIVLPVNKEQEKSLVSIGSTMKGTAAAVVQKMQRDLNYQNIAKYHLGEFAVSEGDWWDLMTSFNRIQLSVPQGQSLSLNHGFFPYCTSRNTSPQQALADAGIPIQWVDKVIACMRTFPIRVANRYNEAGEQIGFSGPCYNDQKEITWEEIGVTPELTSISKKVRRVFSFSREQYMHTCYTCGVTDVFLNFLNYLDEVNQVALIEKLSTMGPKISWAGYGPTVDDIMERMV
jgi:adenylosuccinate synthase